MEPQQQTPRTTADSAKEGRLVVDAGLHKRKRAMLKSILRDGAGGCGKKKKKHDGKGGPGYPDLSPKQNPYLYTGKGGPGNKTDGLLKTFGRIPGVSYQKDVNRPAIVEGTAKNFSDANTIASREKLISGSAKKLTVNKKSMVSKDVKKKLAKKLVHTGKKVLKKHPVKKVSAAVKKAIKDRPKMKKSALPFKKLGSPSFFGKKPAATATPSPDQILGGGGDNLGTNRVF